MKDKLMLFIIGLLLGAIISTGAFFAYSKATTCNSNDNGQTQMNGGSPPSMSNNQNGQPPELPSGDNNQNSDSSNNNNQNDN